MSDTLQVLQDRLQALRKREENPRCERSFLIREL